MLDHEVVISARIGVDENGRVTRAIPVTALGKVEQSIWRAYAPAISTWEFDPAMQNGQKVAGETIMRFRVQPGQ